MRAARRVAAAIVAMGVADSALGAGVSANQQALLLLKIVAYDRNLSARAPGGARVMVVYKDGDLASKTSCADIETALKAAAGTFSVGGGAVSVTNLAYNADWAASARAVDPTAIFLCSSLDGDIAAITAVSREIQALTATSTEPYLGSGAAVGVVPRAEKIAIIVNLPAAKAEGVDLSATLLQIAEVRK